MQSDFYYQLVVTLPLYLLMSVGLFGIFKKAGVEGWKGFVPVYNLIVWMDLIGKPRWWVIWFFVPIMNFIIWIGVVLDLVRSFGKHQFGIHLAAVIVPFFYFPILGWRKQDEYQGKWAEIAEEYKKKHKKGELREWLDAILFAGMAAILIRTFLIEAFMIPTTSMEGSLLAGDFLFVSKFHYGIRMPMVPLSMPFVHNKLPFTEGTKSYLDWVELPYSRLPGLKDIERNEIVVFNYPDDDEHPDVDALGPIEPISMKQNYIKRCVAISGDTLEIRNGNIYINGAPGWVPENIQYSYFVRDTRSMITNKTLEKIGFRNDGSNNSNVDVLGGGNYLLHMTPERKAKIEAIDGVIVQDNFTNVNDTNRLQILARQKGLVEGRIPGGAKSAIFPKDPEKFLWTLDDFGPLWIPKAGETIKITTQNLPIYRKIIDVYEDHDLEVKGNDIYVDGVKTDSYTFRWNYFWMMGDNRHASLDSRFWGFVPETHVVGRPWMVLFSWEGGPRWNRFFNGVGKWEE